MLNLNEIEDIRAIYNQKVGQLNKLTSDLGEVRLKLSDVSHKLEIDTKSRVVLEALSKFTEGSVKQYIEPLVTEAIQAVFGYDIHFGLEFGFERNQVTVAFNLTDSRGNTGSGEIEEITGGGVLDVVGLVLQFVFLELFNLRGPVLLDEPGKNIDVNHQANFGGLIQSFAQKFKRQIVIVTHSPEICAIGTKRYHVTQDSKGISHAELVEEY